VTSRTLIVTLKNLVYL